MRVHQNSKEEKNPKDSSKVGFTSHLIAEVLRNLSDFEF